jgi:hypothetical protein
MGVLKHLWSVSTQSSIIHKMIINTEKLLNRFMYFQTHVPTNGVP